MIFYYNYKLELIIKKKYKTLMKIKDDIAEIFKPFLIQQNNNKKCFLIGFYKKVPRLNKI